MNIEKNMVMALSLLLAVEQLAADSVSSTEKYAWSENAGWLDFNSSHAQVTIYDDHLEGYAWSEAVGWIRLGTVTTGAAHTYLNNAANTYGVNNDGAGNLSGYGWSENAGWIDFNPSHNQVTINTSTGDFDGYAWSESIGWIHFQNAAPAYKVQRSVTTQAAPPSGGPSISTKTAGSGSLSITAKVTSYTLSQLSLSAKAEDSATGIQFPLGMVSYQVTSSKGGSVTVELSFNQDLPSTGFFVYKIDNDGHSTLIPASLWQKSGSKGIKITLTDGGPFDLDGVANGVIIDPIAIGTSMAETLEEFTFPAMTNAPFNQWVSSNEITFKGISEATTLAVAGGFVSIDGGDFATGPVTVGLGQTVQLMLKSASTAGQLKTASVQVGDYQTEFNVSTASNSLNVLFKYGNSCSETAATEVLKAYIAHYNRPADVGGLNFWSCAIQQAGGKLDTILSAFVNTPEFTARYGGLNDSQVIDLFYQQLFKRVPDAVGKAYWMDALQAGQVSYEHIAMAVLNAAQGLDATIIKHKLQVAEYFIEQCGKSRNSLLDYQDVMDKVTEQESSVTAVKALIDRSIERASKLEDTL